MAWGALTEHHELLASPQPGTTDPRERLEQRSLRSEEKAVQSGVRSHRQDRGALVCLRRWRCRQRDTVWWGKDEVASLASAVFSLHTNLTCVKKKLEFKRRS